MRQVHGSNILVCQYHTVGGEVELMSMLQKGDIVELRIEHVVPVLDHSTWPWRDRAAGVDEVNRQATALTIVANSFKQKSSFSNGVVVAVVGSMENKAQLLTSLNGQFLSQGFLGDTFRNASMPLNSPNADGKVPVEKSGERQRHRSNPDALFPQRNLRTHCADTLFFS